MSAALIACVTVLEIPHNNGHRCGNTRRFKKMKHNLSLILKINVYNLKVITKSRLYKSDQNLLLLKTTVANKQLKKH
jgi:hypothetical protein